MRRVFLSKAVHIFYKLFAYFFDLYHTCCMYTVLCCVVLCYVVLCCVVLCCVVVMCCDVL